MPARETVYHIARTILRPGAPAIAMPGRPPDPTLIVGMTVIRTRVVTAAVPILLTTPVRGLGLLHPVWTRLDRQVITWLVRVRLTRGLALWPPLPLPTRGLRILF